MDPTSFPTPAEASKLAVNPVKSTYRKKQANDILEEKTTNATEKALDQLQALNKENIELKQKIQKLEEDAKHYTAMAADLDAIAQENIALRSTVKTAEELNKLQEIALKKMGQQLEAMNSLEGVHMPNTAKLHDVLANHTKTIEDVKNLQTKINDLRNRAQVFFVHLGSTTLVETIEKTLAEFDPEYDECKEIYKKLKPLIVKAIEDLTKETKSADPKPIPEEYVKSFSARTNYSIPEYTKQTEAFLEQRKTCVVELKGLKDNLENVIIRFSNTRDHLNDIDGYCHRLKENSMLSFAAYMTGYAPKKIRLTPEAELAAETKTPQIKGTPEVLMVSPII